MPKGKYINTNEQRSLIIGWIATNIESLKKGRPTIHTIHAKAEKALEFEVSKSLLRKQLGIFGIQVFRASPPPRSGSAVSRQVAALEKRLARIESELGIEAEAETVEISEESRSALAEIHKQFSA